MAKKKSNYFKFEFPMKELKEEIFLDIGVEKGEDGIAIYPRNIAMTGDGNQQTDEDLKESYVSNIPLEGEVKCDSENLINTSTCSSPSSKSSFVFFESESSVQEFKYEKLRNKGNASSVKRKHIESKMKIPFDNPGRNDSDFFDEPVRERGLSNKGTLTVQQLDDETSVRNSAQEKMLVATEERFDSGDAKTYGSPLLLSGEKNPIDIEELREALQNSTNCLLRCLENLHNTAQKQDNLNLERNYSTTKHKLNASKCSEENLMTNKERTNSDVSLSTTHTLGKNSTTHVKHRLSPETRLTRVSSCSKSKHMETTKSRECPCDCCNGKCLLRSTRQNLNDGLLEVAKRLMETTKSKTCPCNCCKGSCCFHFHRTRENLNSDLLPSKNVSKIETVLSMSDRDFSDNLRKFNATLKNYRSRSKHNQHQFPPPSELPTLVRKETVSDKDETESNSNNSTLIVSNSVENQPFGNYLRKSNSIKKEKNKDNCLKRKKKSKAIGIYRTNDQLEKYREGEDRSVSHDNEDGRDPSDILFLAYLFVMCILFCFILFIFFCI